MSLQNFIQQKESVKIGDGNGFIVLDCALSETHTRAATITENEIEDGSKINDHYRRLPDKLSMTGIISEVPVSLREAVTNVATSFVSGTVGGIGGVATQALSGVVSEEVLQNSQNRQLDNLLKLEGYMNNASRLIVITGLKRYTNMMIESINIPRNSQIGNSLQFDITLKEVRIVSSKTIVLPESAIKGIQSHSAASKAELGKQELQEPTVEEGKRASFAFRIAKGIGAL